MSAQNEREIRFTHFSNNLPEGKEVQMSLFRLIHGGSLYCTAVEVTECHNVCVSFHKLRV